MRTVLTLYRRHQKKCPHRKKGRRWTKCQCPVWAAGLFKGLPLKQSLKTTVWTRAQQILTLWELGQFGKSEPAEVTVEAAIARFLEDAAAREIRPSSLKKQRHVLTRLQDWSQRNGLVLLRQINVQAMRDFRSSWQLAAVTSNKMLERLRSFFRFCIDNDWIEKNPAAPLKRAQECQEPTLPFTKEEIMRILQALEEHRQGKTGPQRENAERLRALVLVMRWTGLRISDAVMLHSGQVDAKGIQVRQAKTRVPVRIPVPPEVTAALSRIADGGRPAGEDPFYYFAPGPGDHQTRAGNWRRRLRWLFEKAQVANGHAHRFRDTLAVELLLAGVPIERVSMLLGHESVKTTQKHYSPWVAARQAQLEEDVKRLWGGENQKSTPEERAEPSESASDRKDGTKGMVSRAGLDETARSKSQ